MMKLTKPCLVLVENEVTVGAHYDFWDDRTGVSYQYPNQYRNLVQPGKPFVYYRGVRRSGGRRERSEYFGSGVIGEVWPDPSQPIETPTRNRRWFCAIEDYEPFDKPIVAATKGTSYEGITSSMGWRNGVRAIAKETYERILSDAAAASPSPSFTRSPASLLDPDVVTISIVADGRMMVLPRPKGKGKVAGGSARRSRRAAEIGRWGEEVVYRHLCSVLPDACKKSIDWHSRRGDTPGWDFSYTEGSALICVEVKATTAAQFPSIEMTTNEWAAAQARGESFVLCLVTGACTSAPRIGMIWNLASLAASGKAIATPASYRITIES